MPVRGSGLEFRVPAGHGTLVHASRFQHIDPHLFIDTARSFTGGHLAEHSSEQPLLVFQSDNLLGRLAHSLLEQPGSRSPAGGQHGTNLLQAKPCLAKLPDAHQTVEILFRVETVANPGSARGTQQPQTVVIEKRAARKPTGAGDL